MPQQIDVKINDMYDENDLLVKYASIKIGSGKYIPFLPSINPYRIKTQTLNNLNEIPIENYIQITLDQLRDMDSDQKKQSAFITEKLYVNTGHPTFFIAKILIKPTQKLVDKDIEYIVDLLKNSSNDLMIPPLIYNYYTTEPSEKFPNGQDRPSDPIDTETYLTFLKTFIAISKQRKIENFGLMFPSNFDYTSTDKLLAAYKDCETKLAFIDSRGNKTSQLEPQINKLTSVSSKLYTLAEKNDEKFALYSFDSVPYTARREIAPAHNVLEYLYGFSSFGPRHTVRISFPTKTPTSPPNPPRLYEESEYGYVGYKSIAYKAQVKKVEAWVDKNFKDTKAQDKVGAFKKDYEISSIESSINEIYSNIDNTKFWDKILNRPNLESELKQIQGINKKRVNRFP